jgi:hypothetical protein
MWRLGFDDRWVSLIMVCVRIVTYYVLVNGQPYRHIQPTRGIRQGDLLSPYLFILCAKGPSTLLHMAEQEGKITGLSIAKRGTKINHLFYADDSLLFYRASIPEWAQEQAILDKYERALSQKLNRDKMSIFFSARTLRRRQNSLLFLWRELM